MVKKVRSYSLVSVLAAMIILMGALVPLITLQGRLSENISNWDQTSEIIIIEELYTRAQEHSESKQPGTTQIGYQLKPMNNGLYHLKLQHKQETIHGFVFP